MQKRPTTVPGSVAQRLLSQLPPLRIQTAERRALATLSTRSLPPAAVLSYLLGRLEHEGHRVAVVLGLWMGGGGGEGEARGGREDHAAECFSHRARRPSPMLAPTRPPQVPAAPQPAPPPPPGQGPSGEHPIGRQPSTTSEASRGRGWEEATHTHTPAPAPVEARVFVFLFFFLPPLPLLFAPSS